MMISSHYIFHCADHRAARQTLCSARIRAQRRHHVARCVVRTKIKVVILINGCYFPCPSDNQVNAIPNLIPKKVLPFDIPFFSAGTIAHEHDGCADLIGSTGSLSIVCYVALNGGRAQSYVQTQSLQGKVVELVIDYCQATKEIAGSTRVWGEQFISKLSPLRRLRGGWGGEHCRHAYAGRLWRHSQI